MDMRRPRGDPQVSELNTLMHAVDWVPTLLAAVGVPAPAALDGVSQWAALGGGAAARSDVYSGVDDTLLCRGLRDDDWKLLVCVLVMCVWCVYQGNT